MSDLEVLIKTGDKIEPVAKLEGCEVCPYIIVLKDQTLQEQARKQLYEKGVAVDPVVVLSMVFVNMNEQQAAEVKKMDSVRVIEQQEKKRTK